MILLNAKIAVKKLKGVARTVPKALGGKLQVKHVEPTYEEQVVTFDEEEYDGLSMVVVGAKPRPYMEGFCTDVISNHIVSNTDFAPGGISKEYIPKMYSYNGVVLPEIPPSGYENCPYLMILRYIGDDSGAIWLYGSTSTPYYLLNDSVDRLELPSGRTRSKFDVESGIWGSANIGTSGTWCNLTESWEILWSNHDIPNGSATATEIYFKGTELIPVE